MSWRPSPPINFLSSDCDLQPASPLSGLWESHLLRILLFFSCHSVVLSQTCLESISFGHVLIHMPDGLHDKGICGHTSKSPHAHAMPLVTVKSLLRASPRSQRSAIIWTGSRLVAKERQSVLIWQNRHNPGEFAGSRDAAFVTKATAGAKFWQHPCTIPVEEASSSSMLSRIGKVATMARMIGHALRRLPRSAPLQFAPSCPSSAILACPTVFAALQHCTILGVCYAVSGSDSRNSRVDNPRLAIRSNSLCGPCS